MMKPITLLLLAGMLTSCGASDSPQGQKSAENAAAAEVGTTDTTDTTGDDLVDDANLAADLSYMRQEEKLARDVYITLGETYSVAVFTNIAKSEQTHMDSILPLLASRGLPDPVEGMEVGEFADEHFTELYETLVERGMASEAEAIIVGVDIEELDIVDLNERLEQNPPNDVVVVFERLLAGSQNHLAAFNRQVR